MDRNAKSPPGTTDFGRTRAAFDLPDAITYLDGNSLGPMPHAALERVRRTMQQEWARQLITAWNQADWMDMPRRLGDRVGRLIGAGDGTVVLGDTLSIKVYQALDAALQLRPDRKVVLSDSGNFPSDLYMARSLIDRLGQGHEMRVVAPEALAGSIDQDVAATLITEVDYRTGRKHDMAMLTRKAHEAGALSIWDLAHSAGAIEVDLTGCEADFAVGCTYKFLNSGPGGPAFIYVRPDHAGQIRPALSGWLGHDSPFAFEPLYRPAPGSQRMRVGTPPILQMAALDAALDIWNGVAMADLRARSIELSERFIDRVEATCPTLALASPRDPLARGSHVSFRFEGGYAVVRAMIEQGVIGDFRAPDIMRFGITPLFLDERDIDRAVSVLAATLRDGTWDQPKFHRRAAVT